MDNDKNTKRETGEVVPPIEKETNITSNMIENAHASGAGSIKRSDEAITGKEGERQAADSSQEY